MKVENAVIMSAGYASRFNQISQIRPKALLPVKGQILIERQILQLIEAGITDITVVTGYKRELYAYLKDRYGVRLLENPWYEERNNHSTIYAARKYLGNTYICSADNYFPQNLFTSLTDGPYYSALYSQGPTEEYCLTTDASRRITGVEIGGADSWYMLGHVCFDQTFSQKFLEILEREFQLSVTRNRMWEHIYMDHLEELCLYMKPYPAGSILEFDTLEDLQGFDPWYLKHTEKELLEFLQQPPKEYLPVP